MKKLLISLLTGALMLGTISTPVQAGWFFKDPEPIQVEEVRSYPESYDLEDVIKASARYHLDGHVRDYKYDEEENKITFYSDSFVIAKEYHLNKYSTTDTMEEGIQNFMEDVTKESTFLQDEPIKIEFKIYDKFYTDDYVYEADNSEEIENIMKER